MDTPIKLSNDDIQLLHKVAAGLVQVRGQSVHRLFTRTSKDGTSVTRRIRALDLYAYEGPDGVYELTSTGREVVKLDLRAAAVAASRPPGGRR